MVPILTQIKSLLEPYFTLNSERTPHKTQDHVLLFWNSSISEE